MPRIRNSLEYAESMSEKLAFTPFKESKEAARLKGQDIDEVAHISTTYVPSQYTQTPPSEPFGIVTCVATNTSIAQSRLDNH